MPRVRRHRASSLEHSSKNECCHFAGHPGPINMRLSFPSYMFVCSSHVARVRINRVRFLTPLLVSWIGEMNISLSPFAPEILVTRDGFCSPVPRQRTHLHTRAKYGAYLRDSSRVPRRRPAFSPAKKSRKSKGVLFLPGEPR